MIDLTITLNGVKVVKKIPTSWKEVPFKQFLQLSEVGDDYLKIFEVFTGIEKETIKKCRLENVDTVIALLSFLRLPAEDVIPETILGYKVPKDLNFETIGQYADMQDHMKVDRTGIEQLQQYPLYCAIYCCPEKHGEYDWAKAEAMADEFLDAPATEVLAIGNFTLLKLIALRKGMPTDSLQANLRKKRRKQVSKGSALITASIARFFIWRKKPRLTGTTS